MQKVLYEFKRRKNKYKFYNYMTPRKSPALHQRLLGFLLGAGSSPASTARITFIAVLASHPLSTGYSAKLSGYNAKRQEELSNTSSRWCFAKLDLLYFGYLAMSAMACALSCRMYSWSTTCLDLPIVERKREGDRGKVQRGKYVKS